MLSLGDRRPMAPQAALFRVLLSHALGVLMALVFLTSCYGEDNLVFYNAGRKDQAAWSVLKEFFSSKNPATLFFQGDGVIDRHMERINRINASSPGVFVGVEFVFGEGRQAMVAMAELSREGPGGLSSEYGGNQRLLWRVDELPAKHEAQSRRLAELVAAQFHVKAKRMPLFPALGIDMPGIFVSIECRKEDARSLLATLDQALQKYRRKER